MSNQKKTKNKPGKISGGNTKSIVDAREDGDEVAPLVGEAADVVGGAEHEADFHPAAALIEEEPAELAEEVSLDDLTDDEREMLGLEAKPKANTSDDESETANTGMSWEEFGYDEEELQ